MSVNLAIFIFGHEVHSDYWALQVLLTALGKVLTEWMPCILLLVAILLYICSLIGEFWFRLADEKHWGSLGLSFLSVASMFTVSVRHILRH